MEMTRRPPQRDSAHAGIPAYARLPAGSAVDCDLVKKRVAQAVGIRIPLTRPLVGSQGCGPKRVRAVATVHRQVEPVPERQFGPFPPGSKLPDPAPQSVSM